MAADSCSDSGLKVSSVIEEQRDFQLQIANRSKPYGTFYSCIYCTVVLCLNVQEEITVKLYWNCVPFVCSINPLYYKTEIKIGKC